MAAEPGYLTLGQYPSGVPASTASPRRRSLILRKALDASRTLPKPPALPFAKLPAVCWLKTWRTMDCRRAHQRLRFLRSPALLS